MTPLPYFLSFAPPLLSLPPPPPHSWYFLPSPFSCFPDVFSSPFPLPSLRQELDSNQETEPAPVNTDPDSHSAPETRLIGLFFHFQETLRNAILNLTFYFFPPGSIHLRVQWKCILPTKMFISSLLNISCETAWAAFCFPRKSPQNSRLPIFTGQDNRRNFLVILSFNLQWPGVEAKKLKRWQWKLPDRAMAIICWTPGFSLDLKWKISVLCWSCVFWRIQYSNDSHLISECSGLPFVPGQDISILRTTDPISTKND